MNRRTFLKLTGMLGLSKSLSIVPNLYSNTPERIINKFGWIPNVGKQITSVYDRSRLKGFGFHKTACLWKAYETVRDQEWIAHKQEGPDCVAQATGSGVDILTCCRIALQHKSEKYVSDTSTIMIYAGGRNLIAERKVSAGMYGKWAVDYLKKYGNLLRQEYPPFDLREYSESLLNKYDREGVPEELLEIAKEHPLLDYAQVQSFEEARDSVSAGYPVVFCATLGANNDERDDEGFIKPSGRWPHAWLMAGAQDGKRPGACLINSHGSGFGKGPKTHGQPDGSVWIDAEYIDDHIKQHQDSYALTDYKGFTVPNEDYIIW